MSIMLTCSTNSPRKISSSIISAITPSGGRPKPTIISTSPLLAPEKDRIGKNHGEERADRGRFGRRRPACRHRRHDDSEDRDQRDHVLYERPELLPAAVLGKSGGRC